VTATGAVFLELFEDRRSAKEKSVTDRATMLHNGWEETGACPLWCTAQVECDVGATAVQRLLVEDASSGLLVLLFTLLKTLHVRWKVSEGLK
jgi:hypothetical protein